MPTREQEIKEINKLREIEEIKALRSKESPAAKPQRFTELESGALGLTQGATFGFGDEAAGGILAAVEKLKGSKEGFGKLYETKRDEQRNILKEAQVDNPKSYMGGEVGGALATSFVPGLGPAALGAKSLPLVGRAAPAIGKAAGLGGLAAAGLSENDPTKSPESLGSFAGDVAGGAALGAGFQGVGSALGKAAGALAPEGLREYANKRALSASGFMSKDVKKLSPEQQQKIGRALIDNKVVSVFASLDDIAERSGKGKEAAGQMIGKIGEQIDSVVPKSIDMGKVASELDVYADSIPKTVAGKNLAARVKAEADNFREIGAVGFKAAQDMKGQFKYKFGDSDALISNQDVTNKIRQVINKEMESTVAGLSKDPAFAGKLSQSLLEGYEGAKQTYGSMKTAEEVAKGRAAQLNTQRTFGLTDTIAGAAGLGAGLSGKDADWQSGAGGAIALATLNKLSRRYGAPVQSISADKLANGIESVLAKTPEVLKKFGSIIERAAKQGNKALVGVHLTLMNEPDYAKVMENYNNEQSNAFERRLQNGGK